ncbi:MAG TPA: class I SAM-dependent methyltransferase [Candidatus Acidoferrum sp.]|nr:class I SAM-dependent methyltransferase [Candidatus Acidoferrum sp.]
MSGWKKKRGIMRRYDATAHIYDARYEEEQTAKYAAALENLQKRELGLVLDVGCGTGLLFSYIKQTSRKIVGVDISKKTLFKAKERARNLANVEVILADADFIPLREDIVDRLFAFTVLQNSPNPARTLDESKRISKSEADIVITGLKKVFLLGDFRDLLQKVGLNVESFVDEETLKCYVAMCKKMRH